MTGNFEQEQEVTAKGKKGLHFPNFESVCIIADKVYAHCQQRECFENVKVRIPKGCPFEFVSIVFAPGEIVEGSLSITPMTNRPNFSRVRFRVCINFTVKLKNIETGTISEIKAELPQIQKDIVLYMPEARDEFKFEIVIETASKALSTPYEKDGNLIFTAGVFIIAKIVGKVQLLIPEFGFCPEPPECEEFLPDDLCEEFETAPFPQLFPKQLDDIYLDELL